MQVRERDVIYSMIPSRTTDGLYRISQCVRHIIERVTPLRWMLGPREWPSDSHQRTGVACVLTAIYTPIKGKEAPQTERENVLRGMYQINTGVLLVTF